jgi:phosphoglycolate phosphatase
MNGLLRARGLPLLTLERYQALFDFPVIRYYERLGFDLQREPFEVVGTEFIRTYETRREEAALRPSARPVLEALRARGLTQSVLSAYRHDTLESLLRHFGVRDFFLRVIGSDDHYASGKVEQGRRYVQELHVDPSEVVLVGDTAHDHEVAVAMGVRCLLLPGGNHSRDRLEACGVPVLNDLADLLA